MKQQEVPQPIESPAVVGGEERIAQPYQGIVIMGRGQDAEEVVRNARQYNLRDTSESTIEHIAYQTKASYIANNENLKMRFFPNSLTKNAFTWFTSLPSHSINKWNQLKRVFHGQFYMGKSKISLKELTSVRRKAP